MNLYKISQEENVGYDTYDAVIVCAFSEDDAKTIHPEGQWPDRWSSWCSSPNNVTVELIGTALEDANQGIVLASFNAG